MDKFFESATLYLKILVKASSPVIKDWKQEDLDNALKWHVYFEKAYRQLQGKAKWLQKVDSGLAQLVLREGWVLTGNATINAEFLAGSRDYLCKTLLQNSSLSQELFSSLLQNSPHLQEYCRSVIQEAELLDTLHAMEEVLHCNSMRN